MTAELRLVESVDIFTYTELTSEGEDGRPAHTYSTAISRTECRHYRSSEGDCMVDLHIAGLLLVNILRMYTYRAYGPIVGATWI
jgi:hypothetical protein